MQSASLVRGLAVQRQRRHDGDRPARSRTSAEGHGAGSDVQYGDAELLRDHRHSVDQRPPLRKPGPGQHAAVVVINQTDGAAGSGPIRIRLANRSSLPKTTRPRTVVGVVGDAKHYWLEEEQRPQMYDAYSQDPGLFATVVIRTTVEPLSLTEPVRQAIWKVDADQPMWKIRTVEFLVNRSTADRKFLMALMGIFATLALVLTIIGLYGVISYLVNQRTQEIGIRMALGAQMRDILRMVLKQGMVLVLDRSRAWAGRGWMLTRLMSRLLYQVSATDPLTFAGIALLLIAVALLACYIPARRATKVDPLVALRYE